MAEASKLGRIVIKRAYADWTRHRSDHHALLSLGVDVEQVSSKRGKNAADIRIAIDAMDVLLDKRTTITHVLLVSGDGDFTDLVNRLKFYGKVVIGLGTREATADYLREACDAYIFYEDLIAKKPPPVAKTPRRAKTDLNAARGLLRQVLANRPDEWRSAGKVKQEMRQISPDFDEGDYGFSGFMLFVNEMADVAETRYGEGGHAEVRLRHQGELTLDAARQLMVESLEQAAGEWVLSAQLKQLMRQRRPDFTEGSLGFKGFNAFLAEQADLLETERDENANMRVRLWPERERPFPPRPIAAESDAQTNGAGPQEPLVAQYVRYLRQQQVHVTPSEERPRLVLKVYELFKKQPPDASLAQFQKVLVAYCATHFPHIPQKLVVEVLHQLFWAGCFAFITENGRILPEETLWDKPVTLAGSVTSRAKMLDICDRALLGAIAGHLQGAGTVNLDAAMELLYGRVGSAEMRQHVAQLLSD